MSYITTISMRFKPGTRQDVERVFREVLVAGRRGLVERGDLFSTSMVHLGADAEGEDYQIISHWASKEAHDRNEDNPQDLEAQRAATPFLLTPRSYAERRHQHVERFVRQVVLYGALTGTLFLFYVGGIFALPMAIWVLIGHPPALPIVASTLAAVALLHPLRRRIQGMIDRHCYRDHHDAEQTLKAFRVAAQHEIDVAQLSEHLLSSVHKTMHPAFASLWLFPPHQTSDVSASRSGSDQTQVFGAHIFSDLPPQ